MLSRGFAEVNRQLDAKQLIVRKGTLIDASNVVRRLAAAAAHGRVESAGPLRREPGVGEQTGAELFRLSFARGGRAGTNQIRRLLLTPAHINESTVADALVLGDEAAIYADKGYESKKRRAALKARAHQGPPHAIRARKQQPALPHWQ